jgi:sugar phosphate isomerase/epimerase
MCLTISILSADFFVNMYNLNKSICIVATLLAHSMLNEIAICVIVCYTFTMIVGISTASLFPEYSSEEAISAIKSLDINLVEVFLSTFYEYRPEYAKAMLKRVEGVTVNSVHANSTNFEPNLFNPTRRVRGDGFYWLDQIARSAQLLGCKNYTFHGFHRLPSGGGGDDLVHITSCLNQACEFLAGYGLQLCLENVFWCTYNRPDFFRQIKNDCPNLSTVFDIKQARRSCYPWQMYIEDMAERIAYVHLSDVDERGKMCLPGKGIYNFEEILKRLKGNGFNGNIIIEVYGGDYKTLDELKDSYNYLSEIAAKI